MLRRFLITLYTFGNPVASSIEPALARLSRRVLMFWSDSEDGGVEAVVDDRCRREAEDMILTVR